PPASAPTLPHYTAAVSSCTPLYSDPTLRIHFPTPLQTSSCQAVHLPRAAADSPSVATRPRNIPTTSRSSRLAQLAVDLAVEVQHSASPATHLMEEEEEEEECRHPSSLSRDLHPLPLRPRRGAD